MTTRCKVRLSVFAMSILIMHRSKGDLVVPETALQCERNSMSILHNNAHAPPNLKILNIFFLIFFFLLKHMKKQTQCRWVYIVRLWFCIWNEWLQHHWRIKNWSMISMSLNILWAINILWNPLACRHTINKCQCQGKQCKLLNCSCLTVGTT